MKQFLRFLALACLCGLAAAQGYPSRPITIVVAYPAGGDTDAVARLLGEKLSTRLGQPVIVDNRSGASGIIGSSHVSKAPADGYTLLLAPSTFAIAQFVLKTSGSTAYDVVNGFTPIIQTGSQPLFLATAGSVEAKSVKELVAAAKTGSNMDYASPGSGSPMHVLGEIANKSMGVNFRQVPYKGVAPAMSDVLGSHVPLTYMTYGPLEPYVANGKVRILAVADKARSPLAPNVPTFAELGYAGIEVTAWNGLFGPKGMPADIVKTLNTHVNEILKMPDVAAKFATLGVIPHGGAPDVLAKTSAGDFERFGRVIKEMGIKAD
ncbi:tripartite tricarboxylate transporter substrate binding protein [Comamonadaceae bacterium G21597-S1]|nr:tripartite tricarboxylate transporter substrate binding protein [Comamonadaceae bacterium G21597-S1]